MNKFSVNTRDNLNNKVYGGGNQWSKTPNKLQFKYIVVSISKECK